MAERQKIQLDRHVTPEMAVVHYIFFGDEDQTLKNAGIIGVNTKIDGRSLAQIAISHNRFGIAKRLLQSGAILTKEDKSTLLDNIQLLRSLINTRSYSWRKRKLNDAEKRLSGMEELFAYSQLRKGNSD